MVRRSGDNINNDVCSPETECFMSKGEGGFGRRNGERGSHLPHLKTLMVWGMREQSTSIQEAIGGREQSEFS